MKAAQRCALLLCAWVTSVSALPFLPLGTTRALASTGTLMAGQTLSQVGPRITSTLPPALPSRQQVQCTEARAGLLANHTQEPWITCLLGDAAQNQALCSPDGTVCLVPQGDGNLVLCAPAQPALGTTLYIGFCIIILPACVLE